MVELIQDTVEDKLTTLVPDYINSMFAKTEGTYNVPLDNWLLDMRTTEAAVVTDTSFGMGALGIMFDERIDEVDLTTAFPDMPYKDEAKPS
mgnify:CR=1 FL=1